MKVYLAGPEVFLRDAREIGDRKKELCAKYDVVGLFPFDNEISESDTFGEIDREIYRANVAMMYSADCAIVNLTPFRGPSADAGTVFELGLMCGLGKSVFAYTNDADDLVTRMVKLNMVSEENSRDTYFDRNGMSIENFGNRDNLMIDCSLKEQGHPIVARKVPKAEIFYDLTAFEECLRMMVSTRSRVTKIFDTKLRKSLLS